MWFPSGCGGNDVFDHQGFPRWPQSGVAEQVVETVDAQERVQDAAVAQVDFWGFHDALGTVGHQRRQRPQHEGVGEQFDVLFHGRMADADGGAESRRIEHLPAAVSAELPYAPQSRGWNRNAELGHVPFEKGTDEVLPPLEAGVVAGRQKAVRETATEPVSREYFGMLRCGDFLEKQGGQFEIGNPSGQAFGALADQFRRSRAQDQEPAVDAAGVDFASQNRKDVWHALNFVQTDQLVAVPVQKQFGLGQFLQVGRPFQIKIDRFIQLAEDLLGKR